jgi:geranylgeranyl reductase family protein
MNVTIIGAGPAGLRTAELLSHAGKDVTVLEEHTEIGKPVHCTGIVTPSFERMIPVKKEFLVNRLRKVIIHAPNKETAEIKLNDIVLNRSKFDQYLAERAEKTGAKILLNTRAENISQKNKICVKTKDRTISTDTLIGADGPNSIVGKYLENKKPGFWTGIQARVNMHVEKDAYQVYFGKEFPGFFGWVVPEDEYTARIGTASEKNTRQAFDRLMKKMPKHEILEMQGGLIPKYDPKYVIDKIISKEGVNKKIHTNSANNIYLVGDAATQVKATTGGGIIPGFLAAEALARTINSHANYRKELRDVTKELNMNRLLRNILNRFKDEDHNRLIRILQDEKIRRALSETDRDHATRIIVKSLINKPSLLAFAKVLFQRPAV